MNTDRAGPSASGPGTNPHPPAGPDPRHDIPPGRVLGVDVARGLALLGMMAVHVFTTFNLDGTPTAATFIAGGRSAATFGLLAGVSLAFLSGARRVVQGRTRTAVGVGIAVRALLIGSIGLALGYTQQVEIILPFYAVLFLCAIPMLGLRPGILVGIASVAIVVAPVVLVATSGADLPYFDSGSNPTFGTLFRDPLGLAIELFVSGSYPVIAYIAYLLIGLAIGRLDLSSARIARRLLGGGLAIALSAWFASSVLLFHLGGLAHLQASAGSPSDSARAVNLILWEPDPTSMSTWWWLALRAPHSNSPLDLLHTLGSAMAVLGIALLLTRIPRCARMLWPLAAAGSMTLTFYSAHLIVLATGVLRGSPVVLYIVMIVTVLIFATGWRRWWGQGPLERLVAAAARRARRAIAVPAGGGQALPRFGG